MLKMLRRIVERRGVDAEDEEEARARKLAEGTNVFELVRTLTQELPEKEDRD